MFADFKNMLKGKINSIKETPTVSPHQCRTSRECLSATPSRADRFNSSNCSLKDPSALYGWQRTRPLVRSMPSSASSVSPMTASIWHAMNLKLWYEDKNADAAAQEQEFSWLLRRGTGLAALWEQLAEGFGDLDGVLSQRHAL